MPILRRQCIRVDIIIHHAATVNVICSTISAVTLLRFSAVAGVCHLRDGIFFVLQRRIYISEFEDSS
jgi:hypothetical protein